MDAATPSLQERAEVEAILRSGVFQRAPLLDNMFRYICERHFEGRAYLLKEYTIAVEALGRPAAFDPKKDSIVRVEAHRLRKRLHEYYQGPGAGHCVRITIPNGQYAPNFTPQQESAAEEAKQTESAVKTAMPGAAVFSPEVVHTIEAQAHAARSFRKFRHLWIIGLATFAVCLATLGLSLRSSHLREKRAAFVSDEKWTGTPVLPLPSEVRFLAGYHGAPFTDVQGHTWAADQYYEGGRSSPIPQDRIIEGQPDPHLLKTQRSGEFRYNIPLGKGTYELHLFFAETEYGPGNPLGGGESSRVFQVSINGVPVLRLLDPLAEAGAPNRLDERVFKDISPASDGKLHLEFTHVAAAPFLNAIEILPSTPGVIRPIRIVAQDRPVTDADGRIWSADKYFAGGNHVLRSTMVLDARDKALYRGERYGHFQYRIPLAPGTYRLTLHFAETWFGTPESHLPGRGSRVFDVYANGVALLQNFDIAERAGVNREVTRVFEDQQPNAQGVLSLQFVPVENYAEINAIELVETR
jgi:Di-glucose binding within endoplasmic reticulum.